MRATRAALVAVVLTAALAGCGENAEEGVEKAFRGYHAALLARDFRTACSYNSPDATGRLLNDLSSQGIDAASCEDAFAAIYAEAGGSAAADGVGRTVQIQDIVVTGENATISWTAELDGEQRPARSNMHRSDGQWQFVTT